MSIRSWLAHIPRVEARAVALSLGVGLTLAAVKFGAYFLTGSPVIFSDALESIVNLVASTFAIYSLAIAHRPADESHPYGHGKIEFLSAGIEGGMIFIAAVVGAVKAIDVLAGPPSDIGRHHMAIGIVLMSIALVVNGGLGLYLVRLGRRQSSLTLEADGQHLLSDAWTSVAVLAALTAVELTGWHWIDPIAAIAVSAYIAWVGIRLLRRAEAGLTDRQDKDDDQLLRSVLDAHLPEGGRAPTICSYHKLRHRHAGRYHWVDFHLVMPSDWDIRRGHEVASSIEGEIEKALGEGNATAHIEPCIAGICGRCGFGGSDEAT